MKGLSGETIVGQTRTHPFGVSCCPDVRLAYYTSPHRPPRNCVLPRLKITACFIVRACGRPCVIVREPATT